MNRKMTRKEQALLQWWDKTLSEHPHKSTEFQMQMALDLYNMANPNDPADHSDLVDALDKKGD